MKNEKRGIKFKFFDQTKNYSLKESLLNEYEKRVFDVFKQTLEPKYIIFPQVNLQALVKTNTITRNDELFRNLDFVVFSVKKFTPILAIEINGKQHQTIKYWEERDKSVNAILTAIHLPLLTLEVDDIKKMDNKKINFFYFYIFFSIILICN